MNNEVYLKKALKWLENEEEKYKRLTNGENSLDIYVDRIKGIELIKEITELHISKSPVVSDYKACPKCKHEVGRDSNYCKNCGQKINKDIKEEDNKPILIESKYGDMYNCPHCGQQTEYPWMTAYCPFCGGKLNWEDINKED